MAPQLKSGMFCLFIIFVFAHTKIFAQQILDHAKYKFFYEHTWQFDTITFNDSRDDLIILQIGQNMSKSFSYYTFRVDSLLSTKDGDRVSREATLKAIREALSQGKVPRNLPFVRRMHTRVYKNYPIGQVTVTDNISASPYIYVDELNPQNWEILDSAKTILGYPVQMAVSDFRGRRWIAWFAADIPISDGPWKFSGLPGLIMEAYDSEKHYHFTLVGIERVDNEPIVFSPVVLGYRRYGRREKTTRLEFLRGLARFRVHSVAIMNAQLGMEVFDVTSPNIRHHDLIERDYR